MNGTFISLDTSKYVGRQVIGKVFIIIIIIINNSYCGSVRLASGHVCFDWSTTQ